MIMKKAIETLFILTISIGTLITYHEIFGQRGYKAKCIQLQERNKSLMLDSVKMHKWYENVELNYQELKNLEQ